MNSKLSEKLRMQLATLALKFSYAYGEEWYSGKDRWNHSAKEGCVKCDSVDMHLLHIKAY